DLLSDANSRELLALRLGRHRVDAEPDAIRSIIEHCAHLPLALVVVAARAITGPPVALTTVADQLRDRRNRLDELATDDPATDVRGVFSWSYAALSPA